MSQFFRSAEDKKEDRYSGHNCIKCDRPVSFRVYKFSINKYQDVYCFEDQKELNQNGKGL